LTSRDHLPEKYRLVFDLADGAALAINFWWFGFAHYAPMKRDPKGFGKPLGSGVIDHPMVGKLGPNALDLSLDEFRALLKGRRGAIKTFLLDQDRVAGIGNVYIQDPLFKAWVHPLRPIQTLSDNEVAALWRAIRETLQESIDAGGAPFELSLYGQKGGWIGYREGQPCPECGTPVVKIKTGSTASYICPSCQPSSVIEDRSLEPR
jgi:formamidopyrimidine-DNA glycosylase